MKNVYDMETLAASHRADLLHEARQAALARTAQSDSEARRSVFNALLSRLRTWTMRLRAAPSAQTIGHPAQTVRLSDR